MSIETDLYENIWKYKTSRNVGISKISYPTGTLRVDKAYDLVKGGSRFLDVGCGSGSLAFLVKSRFEEVYGVDISPTAVKNAEKLGIKAQKVDLNEEKLPFKDGFFDWVTCLDVIEHVFEPELLVSELSRVTKKGGYTILNTPNIRYIKYAGSIFLKGKFPKTSGDLKHSFDGGHIHYFTFKDVKKLFETHGFRVVNHVSAHTPESKRKLKYRLLKLLGPNFEKEFLSIEVMIVARRN